MHQGKECQPQMLLLGPLLQELQEAPEHQEHQERQERQEEGRPMPQVEEAATIMVHLIKLVPAECLENVKYLMECLT